MTALRFWVVARCCSSIRVNMAHLVSAFLYLCLSCLHSPRHAYRTNLHWMQQSEYNFGEQILSTMLSSGLEFRSSSLSTRKFACSGWETLLAHQWLLILKKYNYTGFMLHTSSYFLYKVLENLRNKILWLVFISNYSSSKIWK